MNTSEAILIPEHDNRPPNMRLKANDSSSLALARTLRMMDLLRSIDSRMNLGAMCAFLEIAGAEGLSITDLHHRMGIGMATASRYARYLGATDRRGNPGPELVELTATEYARRKSLLLSPQGRLVVAQITNLAHLPFGGSAKTKKPRQGASLA